jgi:hypothetical protein
MRRANIGLGAPQSDTIARRDQTRHARRWLLHRSGRRGVASQRLWPVRCIQEGIRALIMTESALRAGDFVAIRPRGRRIWGRNWSMHGRKAQLQRFRKGALRRRCGGDEGQGHARKERKPTDYQPVH